MKETRKQETQEIKVNEKENKNALSTVVGELVYLIFKSINEGQMENVRKQYVSNIIIGYRLTLRETYNWLLNHQYSDNSNSIYLLGYFNYYGIATKVNLQIAFKLYQTAAELVGSHVA